MNAQHENLFLDSFDENSMINTATCEIGVDGILFPKADLKLGADGIRRISTGLKMNQFETNISCKDVKI